MNTAVYTNISTVFAPAAVFTDIRTIFAYTAIFTNDTAFTAGAFAGRTYNGTV